MHALWRFIFLLCESQYLDCWCPVVIDNNTFGLHEDKNSNKNCHSLNFLSQSCHHIGWNTTKHPLLKWNIFCFGRQMSKAWSWNDEIMSFNGYSLYFLMQKLYPFATENILTLTIDKIYVMNVFKYVITILLCHLTTF